MTTRVYKIAQGKQYHIRGCGTLATPTALQIRPALSIGVTNSTGSGLLKK